MHAYVTSRQYVTFRLHDEQFAVEVTRSREILDLVPVTRVPQTPDYLLGVINLRGQVVPVVDLRVKLGLPKQESTRDSCIIVMEVRVEEEILTVGGLADSVHEVLEISEDQIEPPPRLGTKFENLYLRGVGKSAGHFILILDIDKIFSTEELADIQEADAEFLAEA